MRARGISQARLLELFEYDRSTGLFKWKVSLSNRCPAGSTAGTLHTKGYIRISIDRVFYYAHHLAWLYVYGVLPKILDHINLNPSDNRIENLRIASMRENQANRGLSKNNTSGVKGVRWESRRKKWVAKFGRHGYAGAYDDIDEAAEAYIRKARSFAGEFARSA